jgi:hypothetical protein
MEKAKDKLDMQSILEGQLIGIEGAERELAKQKRLLAVDQDDLKKQQAVAQEQVSSLAYQRANNKTNRKKLKTSHSKALQGVQHTMEREKRVSAIPTNASRICRV